MYKGPTKEEAEEKIREMVRRIVEKFAPEKIVLFGSYARGDAGPDSDVDLLVVMPVPGSKWKKSVEIGVALHGMGIPKDVIVATPQEVERKKDVIGTIIRPALKEGRMVYSNGR